MSSADINPNIIHDNRPVAKPDLRTQIKNIKEAIAALEKDVSFTHRSAFDSWSLAEDFIPTGGLGNELVVAAGSTVAIAIADRFARIKYVDDFGAFGDGTSDDSAAVQAAINACNGHAIALTGGKTYRVNNAIVNSSSGCTGVVGVAGRPIIKQAAGATAGTNVFVVDRDDFLVHNIFADMPISTDPVVLPLASAFLRYSGTGGNSRIYISGCRIRGGNHALYLYGADSYIMHNVIENTWGDSIDVDSPTNCHIIDNVVKDGCYSSTAIAGAIRIGNSTYTTPYENLIIARNIITNCALTSHQSSIDCFSSCALNIMIFDNVCDLNGSGIELKTNALVTTPLVYQNIFINNNFIRLATAGVPAVVGIALNLGEANVPDAKAANAVISNNFIMSDTLAPAADTMYGISGSSYGGVSTAFVIVKDNIIRNFSKGINLAPLNTVSTTMYNLIVQGNLVYTSGPCLYNANAATDIINLQVVNNHFTSTTQSPISFANCPVHGAYVERNTFIALASIACDFRDMHGLYFQYNTVKAGSNNHGVVFQGTASDNVECFMNNVETDPTVGLDGFNVLTGTVTLLDNRVRVSKSRRVFSGTGTITAAGNIRGVASSDPSVDTAGSLGDIIRNSAPSSGGVKDWICTTAGNAAAAVYKGTAIP